MPREFAAKTVFQAIAKQDILLHHPFDSFTPVIDFVQQAAVDPNVLAIKHTLYRTSTHSPIIENLVAAARAGKEVTVIIELRARFDEAANIDLATKLQEAGVHVVYGIVGYKTHCKMILVVRREGTALRRYIHLGTGNYHPKTARLYTDYGLFSANEDLAEDVHQVFNQITSLMQTPRLKLLYQSPFTLHRQLLALIKRETEHARRGSTGHIIAKINALVEPEIIRALYEASMSGVLIDLIVRGVCCLRPGIPGVSESIRVRSIVSRFLEHTRCYYFHNDGDEEVFCASADWMDRNFFRRVEVMFPVLDAQLRGRLLADLDIYLSDNSQAWELRADGSYRANRPAPGERPVSAQAVLLAQYSESS
jgi:polyphosphate kinase